MATLGAILTIVGGVASLVGTLVEAGKKASEVKQEIDATKEVEKKK